MVGCSQHGAERSEFSRFPAAKTTTAPLQKIDWESHPQARSYRTRLKELIDSKADFAGHYIILEIGAGTMACAYSDGLLTWLTQSAAMLIESAT